MASYDLTPKIAPNLDRHLVFPLLEFLQERNLYPDVDILKAKIELLKHTNMVDYAMDIHKSLYHTEDVPQDMIDRRVEVVARLKSLEESAASLLSFLQNPSMLQELHPDRQYNLHMLQERYQIGPEQIEALYQYAKFQFECGNYSGAADFLYQYRALCTNSERNLSALWGKLAAEILMQNWDIALDELNKLREIIDAKNFQSPLNQLQSRIWLMHWSLFIFFNHDSGRSGIVDLFLNDRYLNAIQTNSPHLMRYLATALIISKKRRPQLKEFIKVIQQEQYSYKDPTTEFLQCLYVNYDFDGAQQKLRECEEVILNDPFLGKRVEEGKNFTTVPLRDEFLENASLVMFETYCQIHQCIDIGLLAEKLNMTYDEAERWIVNLVRNAKIDLKSGTVVMEPNHVNVYEQLIKTTKALSLSTYKLPNIVLESAQAQACNDSPDKCHRNWLYCGTEAPIDPVFETWKNISESFLNSACSVKNDQSSTKGIIKFGIYKQAMLSGIFTKQKFLSKYMYCLWWGLQNLSTLGQGLETRMSAGDINCSVWLGVFCAIDWEHADLSAASDCQN